MRVILSRKGFDSAYGGFASPIMPNKALLSLPIPSLIDTTKYSKLSFCGKTLYEIIKELKGKIKVSGHWQEISKKSACHLDPDIYECLKKRPRNWHALFGQIGASQAHLQKQNIGKNDLFLFFGTFRETIFKNGKLCFAPGSREKHIIFGYFQIKKVLYPSKLKSVPHWVKEHAHMHAERLKNKNNAIYVARKKLSWNKKIKGFGTFLFAPHLTLTKKGCSKAIWQLPEELSGIKISYHKADSWIGKCTLKAAPIGQEFVFEKSAAVENWAKELIEKCVEQNLILENTKS